jgi:hypothetical protein
MNQVISFSILLGGLFAVGTTAPRGCRGTKSLWMLFLHSVQCRVFSTVRAIDQTGSSIGLLHTLIISVCEASVPFAKLRSKRDRR